MGRDIFSETPKNFLSLIKRFPYYGFSFGFDKNLKNRILPFPIIPQHDIYIGLIASLKNQMIICSESLCAHRKFINDAFNVNTSDSGFKESLIVKIFYRFKLIFFALMRSLK